MGSPTTTDKRIVCLGHKAGSFLRASHEKRKHRRTAAEYVKRGKNGKNAEKKLRIVAAPCKRGKATVSPVSRRKRNLGCWHKKSGTQRLKKKLATST